MTDSVFDYLDGYSIYVVGLGIQGATQMTREVEAAIRRSREVLYVAAGPSVADALAELCPKVTDLHGRCYQDGRPRIEAYDAMSTAVIEAALDGPPVTFAVYGHPLMFVYPSQQVARASQFVGLRAKILPGISSLDCMLVDLGLDPGIQGLQIYEATELMVRRRPLQADVPCLLWQVGAVETNLFSVSSSRPERFGRIKEYLLGFYPATHRVASIYSASDPRLDPQLKWFAIGDIEKQAADLHQGLTMYIPPTEIRPVQDRDLVRRLESDEHLATITG